MNNKPWIGILAAPPKSGKTHLALTASRDNKVILFDSERGSEYVIEKHFEDHKENIIVNNVSSWNEFRDFFKNSMTTIVDNKIMPRDLAGSTIIIDSFTDILAYLESYIRDNLSTNKPHFAVYGEIDSKFIETINYIRDQTKANLILTTHIKPVFKNDKETDEVVPKARQKFLHLADFVAQYNDKEDYWDFNISRWKPAKQHWTIEADPFDSTINQIVASLQEPIILDQAGREYGYKENPKHR